MKTNTKILISLQTKITKSTPNIIIFFTKENEAHNLIKPT